MSHRDDAISQAAAAARGIVGAPVDALPDDCYVCPSCGQDVPYADLGAVLHHEVPGRKPLLRQ